MRNESTRRDVFAGAAGAIALAGGAAAAGSTLANFARAEEPISDADPIIQPPLESPALPEPTPASPGGLSAEVDSVAPIPKPGVAPEFAFDVEVQLGQSPFHRDEDSWRHIVQRFEQKYALLATGTPAASGPERNDFLSTPLAPPALSIDSSFVFAEAPGDADFNYLHAESLLNDAADLLDRCLATRVEWEDKAAKAASIALEVMDYIETDKIHQAEIEAGYYTRNFKYALREWEALQEEEKGLKDALEMHEKARKAYYSVTEKNRVIDWAMVAAWANTLPVYGPPPGNPQQYKYSENSPARTVAQHLRMATQQQLQPYYGAVLNNFASSLYSLRAEYNAVVKRRIGAGSRARWEQLDADFRRRRADVARNLADLKVRMSTEVNGVLNYAEKMEIVQKRFFRDYRDALARLAPAALGLHLVYGYDSALPGPCYDLLPARAQSNLISLVPSLYPVSTGSASPEQRPFDDVLRWVRDSISWLVAFSQQEERYVRMLSVRRIIGEQAWKTGVIAKSWTVPVSDSNFPNQRTVRLRAVSARVVSGRQGLWSASVRAPEIGRIRRVATSSVPEYVDIRQTHLKPADLGRVLAWNDNKESDVGGVVSLNNASPIGTWRIELSDVIASQGSSSQEIDDLLIELHVLGRPV